MSLYYEAAAFLSDERQTDGSIKSKIYSNKTLKSKPANVYALICKATKWSAPLKQVIERAEILNLERKADGGIAAPKSHVLSTTISKHKARLRAEFTRARLKEGVASVKEWEAVIDRGHEGSFIESLDQSSREEQRYPRWIRINIIKTTLADELKSTFVGYKQVSSLQDVLEATSTAKVLHVDSHISSLIAVPPGADFSKSKSYLEGKLIFQDKASCFPAYLLSYGPKDGDCIDACAAPGNKTTHLAAALYAASQSQTSSSPFQSSRRIWACERDKLRALTLKKMVHQAGANNYVTCLVHQDFLDLDPSDSKWAHVGALLLDPSCSGSGIVGRDDAHSNHTPLFLPSPDTSPSLQSGPVKGKKRKRQILDEHTATTLQGTKTELEEATPLSAAESTAALKSRLESLSNFQTKLLTRAMLFPSAHKITYSTCSIHAEENEHVVLRALSSEAARVHGWKILERNDQVDGMRAWHVRGSTDACSSWQTIQTTGSGPAAVGALGPLERDTIANACIRCEKGTADGTMGFFVAGFVRERPAEVAKSVPPKHISSTQTNDPMDLGGIGEEEGEDEWEGFSDSS